MDAKTGKLLWKFNTGGAIRGQITYQVNGVQFIAVPSSGDLVMTSALLNR